MIKAYPRAWIDLKTTEVFSVLSNLLTPKYSRSNSLVPEFEKAYANFISTKEAVSFTNCRSALYFALKALNFNKGDEVILPAFTFWVEVEIVILAGLKPVFVDVELETLNIDPSKIEAAITPKTRAILFAHLNGLPVDMGVVMETAKRHNLRVIEDCARACGSRFRNQRVGSFDIGCFSFGYGKSFYGFGGGMITSNDSSFINSLRILKREFKEIPIRDLYKNIIKGCILKFANSLTLHRFTLFPFAYKYMMNEERPYDSWFEVKKLPINSVPDAFSIDMFNIQAKMGHRQIKSIDKSNLIRKEHMRTLRKELSGIEGLQLPPDPSDRENVCVHFVVHTKRKQELQGYLLNNRIDAQDESAEAVTQLKRYSDYVSKEYPNAEKLNNQVIYLPCHPIMTKNDVLYVAKKVKEFYAIRPTPLSVVHKTETLQYQYH